jgi:magnesium-transporting ATPase (P-type)
MISAARLGLYTHGNRCLSGKEVENMSDDELSRVIDKVTVLYRTTPKNKNKIVRVSTDDIM